MKFELFGKLRDDDTGSDGSSEISQQTEDTGMSEMGSGLERTVERMFSQGYSEEEIKQELEGQYAATEIQQAVNRTVTSSATGDSFDNGPEPMQRYDGGQETVSPMDEGFNSSPEQENFQEDNMNQQEPLQQSQPEPQQPVQNSSQNPAPQNGAQNNGVEELVETIVAENFEMVESEFENVYREMDEMKEKIEDLDERVHDLEVRDDEDQTQFIQKMDEIEDNIDSYQSRIGGLEKAFQQVLPSLVDNVRELTDLVQEIKQERGIETSSSINKDDIEDMDMEDWD